MFYVFGLYGNDWIVVFKKNGKYERVCIVFYVEIENLILFRFLYMGVFDFIKKYIKL